MPLYTQRRDGMQHAPNYRLAHSIICLFLVSGCSTGAALDITIQETDRGAVYIERSDDPSIQAAHPITISKDMIARTLRGITVQTEPGFLRSLVGAKPEPLSVFREEEVQFLAPLLVEGLATAAPDQRVGFRLGPPRASTEAKTGALYAYRRSLYVTLPWLLLESRHGAGGNARAKTIIFSPESARRSDNYRGNSSPDTTVIIDYELLAALPESPTPVRPVPPPSAAGQPSGPQPSQASESTDVQLRTLQEQMREKNAGMEELKKELQEIRKQLSNRQKAQEK